MARMRTIQGVIKEIKTADPNSEFKEWTLRQLVKSGKIKSVRVGTKYLINVETVIDYLRNPPEEEEQQATEYGVLRKVNS